MKISIVIAYYNRRDLLLKTLQSISKTQYRGDFEIVIVDDASNDPQRINDLPTLLSKLNLKVIQIRKNTKWWINPCIPYNIGFEISTGDVIIIQNPECLHIGDIVSYVDYSISQNKYIVFGCYSINKEITKSISKMLMEDVYKKILSLKEMDSAKSSSKMEWYQHSKFNPRCLHFCTAITRSDLEDLGGFDESYANGIGKDDKDFILRIRKKGMNVDMVDDPFIIHQFHKHTDYSRKELFVKNSSIFNKVEKSGTFRVVNKHTKSLVEKVIRN